MPGEDVRLLVGAPVRNRGWILNRYLDSLTRAVGMAVSDSDVGFAWLVNDSSDNTLEILTDFRRNNSDRYGLGVHVDVVNFGDRPMDTSRGVRLARERYMTYPILASLRNSLISRDYPYFSHFLSVDSDILVDEMSISMLIRTSMMMGLDVVGGLVRNGEGAFNYLIYDESSDRFVRRGREHEAGLPFMVGLTGAFCLYSRRACKLGHFRCCESGEDEGMARSLMEHGIRMWVEPRAVGHHVMCPDSDG